MVMASAALLCGVYPALAQTAPPLGALQQFAILGNTTVTAAGTATITNGDVGVSPGTSITGNIVVAPGFFIRTPLTGDAALLGSAQLAATAVSANLLAQGPGNTELAELGGTTKTPGVYSFASTANIANNTTLTLDAQGDANAIWIFLVGSAITANTNTNVVFLGGVGNPCNVFWRVVSDATLLGNNFPGTVIAGAGGAGSVTVGIGMNLTGRAVSLTAAVTMSGAAQTIGGCSSIVSGCPPITVIPATLPNGTVGTFFSQTITASGGTPPITFAVSAGTLPPGLTLSAGGILSGTPTTAGTSNFTIEATDSLDCPGTRDYSLVIGFAVVLPPGGVASGPTLDSFGLAILLALLAVAGVFAVNRFTS